MDASASSDSPSLPSPSPLTRQWAGKRAAPPLPPGPLSTAPSEPSASSSVASASGSVGRPPTTVSRSRCRRDRPRAPTASSPEPQEPEPEPGRSRTRSRPPAGSCALCRSAGARPGAVLCAVQSAKRATNTRWVAGGGTGRRGVQTRGGDRYQVYE